MLQRLAQAYTGLTTNPKQWAGPFRGQMQTAFEGKRDLYEIFGYDRNLGPEDLRFRYERGGIAHAVVSRIVNGTWRGTQQVTRNGEPDDALTAEATRLQLWNTMHRLDTLAGVTRYSAAVFPDEEVTEPGMIHVWGADKLQCNVLGDTIKYTLEVPGVPSQEIPQDRIEHVAADGVLDNRLYGLSLLEPVWNDLDKLDYTSGGGAEAFFRRCDPGGVIKIARNTAWTEKNESDLNTAMQLAIHGFKRLFKLPAGVEYEQLQVSTSEFAQSVQSVLTLIAGASGIPLRSLSRAEPGQQAVAQQRLSFHEQLAERRDYATDNIALPILSRLFPDASGLGIKWNAPDHALTFEEQLQQANAMTDSGAFTNNEIREVIGYEPRDDEDDEPEDDLDV